MIRHRYHTTVALGRFNDALEWVRAMNSEAKTNGWAEWRVMVPFTGPVNQLIMEAEYPDVAAYDKEQNEFFASATAMKIFRSGIDLGAPGTHPWDELETSMDQDIA